MRKIATRKVTAADLALARKLLSEIDNEERVTTNSRTMAQAIVNVRWVMAEALREYQEGEATGN